MTWSYSTDPSTSDLDAVRFHLQDTDGDDPLLPDEEIQFVIDQWADVKGSNVYAASVCAERLAAKFAREMAVSADGVSVGAEALQQKYDALALSLRDEYKEFQGTAGAPLGNGTIFDNDVDPSLKPLMFHVKMHDNARAGIQEVDGGPLDDKPYYSIPEAAL